MKHLVLGVAILCISFLVMILACILFLGYDSGRCLFFGCDGKRLGRAPLSGIYWSILNGEKFMKLRFEVVFERKFGKAAELLLR